MSGRFRFANPPAGDFELPDVEAVLDALESAVVTPETPVFDAARQSWQPVGRHPEVRAAWAERARYLPPGAGLGELMPDAVDEPDEPALRRQAWEMVKRGNRVPLPEPATEREDRRRGFGAVAVAGVLMLIVLLGWGLVTLAGQLSRVGKTMVRTELRR
ncbi:MAG TPA: hypothetical protein VJQ44_18875 [Gemmatimonadales bacterium]|nr:hypothetical protein [Gemmatimonadales bacterium]